MKKILAATAFITALVSIPAIAENARSEMVVVPLESQTTSEGPAEFFTGSVSVIIQAMPKEPSRVTVARVSFSPGARSAWHSHPLGQTLIVTDGIGWVQQEGGKKIVIKVGDVVSTPPGVKHWHGGSAKFAMTHTAIQELKDGKNVEWMEQVTDQEYLGASLDSTAQ
ncbi:cupin domain-containing protein [Allohahella sp. A8]|uniref:(R)-mandelonitrile lyase n=1 Tax=Allohahella sp. A8 TaxID=3141461 RepID=UPI003A80F354